MEISLPYQFSLRAYQMPIWKAMVIENKRRALQIWPRRNGKDLVDLNILIAKAASRKALYFYMAPYYTQVRSAIWNGTDGQGRRFLDYIPKELIKKKNDSSLTLELINGSIIRFVGSDNIDSIVGNNPYGIIMTEFSLHKQQAWDYLRPVLAENGGWAIFNGTPRGLNHFYRLSERVRNDPDWFFQKLTRDDTGFPSLEAIEEDRRSGMPESLIQQEYYTSFTASTEETLIPLDIIQPNLDRILDPDMYTVHSKRMGVDVAFAAKGDQAVISKRQGPNTLPLMKYQGMDNMEFASVVDNQIKEWKPDAVFIDAGRGEGVIARLQQLGHREIIIPVNFGGKATRQRYINKRTEMYIRLKNWLKNPVTLPNDSNLIAGLSGPTFDIDDKNRIVLETKKHMKARGIGPFDESDALALTFAESEDSIKPKAERDIETLFMKHKEYDPLTYLS